jgi:hypothetical protein
MGGLWRSGSILGSRRRKSSSCSACLLLGIPGVVVDPEVFGEKFVFVDVESGR